MGNLSRREILPWIGPAQKVRAEVAAVAAGKEKVQAVLPGGRSLFAVPNPVATLESGEGGSRIQKLRHYFEYLLIRFFGALLSLFPLSFLLSLSRPLGPFLFHILPRSRKTALENLRQVYGSQKSEAEICQMAKETFVYLSEFGMEWLCMAKIARRPAHYLGIEGVRQIHAALQKKRGAMLLVSHNANWEIMALIAGRLIAEPVGAAIYALARPLKNPYLYYYVLRLRGLTGLKSISKIGAVRQTFKRLKQNGIVCLLIDQRVNEGAVEARFFGRKALTTSLPAIAAIRLGTPLFHVFMRRHPGPKYVMEIEGPILIAMTGNRDQDIRINTQKFNDRIEEEIRKNPARWLWMHNRWRIRHGPKD